jgi:tetratricopeptide (TPR) repeat protein
MLKNILPIGSLLVLPDDADALALLGRIQAAGGEAEADTTFAQAAYTYLERGRPGDALRTLDLLGEAVAEDPGLTSVRAEALRLDGQFEAAVAEYDRALAGTPDDPWILGGRGAALMSLDRLEDARVDLDRAVALEPESTVLLITASELALRMDDLAAARTHAQRAVAIDSSDATGFELLARVEAMAGSFDVALGHIRTAQALDASGDVDLLRLHARLEHRAGTKEKAAELYFQLCEQAPSVPGDHSTLAELLVDLGRVDDAARVAEGAARRWDEDAEVVGQHGELLIRAGRPGDAVEVLRRATDLEPRSAQLHLHLALALNLSGAKEEALSEAQTAAKLAPTWSEPHRIKAEILADAERWEEAVSAAEAALERDPDSTQAMAVLARGRLHAGATDEAVALLRRVLQVEPDDAEAQFLLAQALLDTQPLEALEILDRPPPELEGEDEPFGQWLLLRGQLLSKQRRWQEADADLTRVIELGANLADAWAERSDVARMSGRAVQALADAEEALRLDPSHVFARCCRAAALIDMGRTDEAREELDAALQLDPEHAGALVLLSKITDDPDTARSHLEGALASQPENRYLRVERAWLEVRFGEYQRALDLFDRLVEEDRDAEALSGRADALRLLGRASEAVAAATEAVERDPDPQNLRSLGLARLTAGETAEAIEALSQAHENRPDDVGTAADLGYAFATADRMDEALDVLDKAVAHPPADTWALGQLVNVLNDIGQFDWAAQLARRGVDRDPGDVSLWGSFGWALEYKDPPDLPGAGNAYQQAWERQPQDDPDPWLLSGIADIHHLRGDPRRAATEYQKALEIADRRRTMEPTMLSIIGWCQFRLGDFQNAARAFLESSSIDPLPGSDVFDLALVILCDGRHQRGKAAYGDAIARIEKRHPMRRSGYLQVALADLRQALRDHPELRDLEIVVEIESALTSTLDALPLVPNLAVLRLPDEPSR